MSVATLESNKFELEMRDSVRILNGEPIDEKNFVFMGLRFETAFRPKSGTHYSQTLRVLQGKAVLLEHHCDSFYINFQEPDTIRITWSSGAMGKTHGYFTIVPGWKIGEESRHDPDVQC